LTMVHFEVKKVYFVANMTTQNNRICWQ